MCRLPDGDCLDQAQCSPRRRHLPNLTAGVECRKDVDVVDEIPGAYKDLESVIAAQTDLVEVVARLTTLMCVKG